MRYINPRFTYLLFTYLNGYVCNYYNNKTAKTTLTKARTLPPPTQPPLHPPYTSHCTSTPSPPPVKTYKCRLSLIDPRDKLVLWTELDDLSDKLQWSSVATRRYYQLS